MAIVTLLSASAFYVYPEGMWGQKWGVPFRKKAAWANRLNELQADHQALHQRLREISTHLTTQERPSNPASTSIEPFKREMKRKMGILAHYMIFSHSFYQGGEYTQPYQNLAQLLPEDLKASPAFQGLGIYAAHGLPSIGQILNELKSSYRHMPNKVYSLYERFTEFLSAFVQITSPETLQLRRHLEALIQEGKLRAALSYRDEHFASRNVDTHLLEKRLHMLDMFDQFNRQMTTSLWEVS